MSNTTENTSKNELPAVQATLTINSRSILHGICALAGAGAVLLAFHLLKQVGALFTPALPFIGGGFLFATLVTAFFMLLRLQKSLRRSPRLRLSFAEAYTGCAVFISMGYFATACMHAFLADGLAHGLWTNGVVALTIALVGFGMGKFGKSLWNEGKTSR